MPHVALLAALALLLSVRCSPTPPGQTQPGSRGAAGPDEGAAVCPSCALAELSEDSESSQPGVVDAVKRHILNVLHLSAPPNVSRPVPRAALLNALRKLHVGRVAPDGTVDVEAERDEPGDEQPSEIITFAEPGGAPDVIRFDVSKDDGPPSVVEQADVWIFLKLAKGSPTKNKVSLQLLRTDPETPEGVQVSQKKVDPRRSGWHALPVGASVQSLLDGGGGELRLRVSCPLCAGASAAPVLSAGQDRERPGQSHRPFLMVALRPLEDRRHRRSRRGLECDGRTKACCKRHFYVDFKDIGWSDWIIAPSGYHANYCEGECPGHAASMAGTALSFHSTVINHYRMRGYGPFGAVRSCCVPTRLRAMSMLYYNEEQKIIKKDIQNMIVEECGCS